MLANGYSIKTQIHETTPDDIYPLCSDGLNKESSGREIEAILNSISPEQAVPESLEQALAWGARDNTTIVSAAC